MQAAEIPETGAVVLDRAQDRVGVVLYVRAGMVHLRPAGDGEPWVAHPRDVSPAGPSDTLRAKVAEVNAARRWAR
ncbi:hypothetical protein [Streptomyces sp. RPT161]|uniref:hypothetical protein n=1 Tax=Streptomyces sp. RPT161 TaxID=3015993 RepID=UPI0022B85A26|nr:hypothetical protein [Streptomyces sp. RPT161]